MLNLVLANMAAVRRVLELKGALSEFTPCQRAGMKEAMRAIGAHLAARTPPSLVRVCASKATEN